MQRINLDNRPAVLPPRNRIEDFVTASSVRVRVSLKLIEAGGDKLLIDAQAFEVNADGININAPDGRPSRTPGTQHAVLATSLASVVNPDGTHTLNPGWVRIVGDYDAETFEPTASRSLERPSGEPDWDTNPTGQHYNAATGIGYRWDEGEVLRIARSKVDDLISIISNSAPIAGIDF